MVGYKRPLDSDARTYIIIILLNIHDAPALCKLDCPIFRQFPSLECIIKLRFMKIYPGSILPTVCQLFANHL